MPFRLIARRLSAAASCRIFQSEPLSCRRLSDLPLLDLVPLLPRQTVSHSSQRSALATVAILMEPSAAFVQALTSCVASSVPASDSSSKHIPCAAVPLHTAHPLPELLHVVRDSGACAVLTHDGQSSALEAKAAELAKTAGVPLCPLASLSPIAGQGDEDDRLPLPSWKLDSEPAYIVYTSGTTGRPKGVVVTHGNARARCAAVAKAWRLGPSDVTLNCLPLHHVHGLENCLLAPLQAGGSVVLNRGFRPEQVWQQLIGAGVSQPDRVSVFMAVPTVYTKLLAYLDERPEMQRDVREACETGVRLMVSGSAPLPAPVMQRWHAATGHWLLERYGMTEVGMALGNPLAGPRVPGSVGRPFPGVRARIRDADSGRVLLAACENETQWMEGDEERKGGEAPNSPPEVSGSLELSGPLIFHEYLNRPADTAKEFTEDGWFRTGDTAAFSRDGKDSPVNGGRFRLLGRSSVDIVKSGGFKISALEVEAVCAGHPDLAECAVVGAPDDVWGERLVLFAVPATGDSKFLAEDGLQNLQAWAADRLAKYKLPRQLCIVDSLPRNAMGKVDKAALKRRALSESEGSSS